MTMIWFIYNCLFAVGFTLLLPRFLLRMRKRGGYARNFSQRFAVYAPAIQERLRAGRPVWIHAVSVGELFVALRFMDELRARRPDLRFVLTTTTSTGYALAGERIKDPDLLLYFPADFPLIMRRALDQINPRAVVLVECELWPNLIRMARRRGVSVTLINGRISDRSYPRYRKLGLFTRPLLRMFDAICAQSEIDRDRLVTLGADPARVQIVGSAKYDMTAPDPGSADQARAALASAGVPPDATILLGGSTWPGEEEVLLDIYAELKPRFPALVLVLVPRHAERGNEVEEEIAARGLRYVRRSRREPPPTAAPDVLLVDTTGELRSFYTAATLIFVGKSLFDHGGQNIIEPALCGKPIVVGPHMENFAVIARDFLAARALIQVPDADGLRAAIVAWLADLESAAAFGRRARELVQQKAGAVRVTADRISPLIPAG